MKPLHSLSPLRKKPGYPTTSVDLTIADVTYDLILPAEISDEVLVHFIEAEESYLQVSRYCNADGLDAIRARPTLLDDQYPGVPTFAITLYGIEDANDDVAMIGWVAVRLAAGPLAARRLYNRACRRESMSAELADYLISHDAYFQHCGGFELLRIRYYFDADDRSSVMRDIEADEPPVAMLKERKASKLQFRDFNLRTEQFRHKPSTKFAVLSDVL